MTEGESRPEFDYAILRVSISFYVLAFVGWYVRRDGIVTGDEVQALLVAFAFFVFAVAITIRILQDPAMSKARRILGIVVDNAFATYALVVLGEAGAIILSVYLFITLGSVFRFGRFYLHISQVLSVTGFWFVMVVSPFWSQHPAVGVAFLITLVIIPLYVGASVERIVPASARG